MPRNDEGEFELVLGNKQLLTVFFIVVVLLGIFATMGYIVGRSTAPVAPAETKKEAARPAPVYDPRAQMEASQEAVSKPAPSQPSDGGSRKAEKAEPAPAAERPAMEAKAAPERPREASAPKREAPAAAGAGPLFLEPSPGQTFLQVLAVAKADAEIAVNALRKKDLRAYIAPGPPGQDKLYRVVVGPLEGPAAVAETRAKLKDLGFENPMLRKY